MAIAAPVFVEEAQQTVTTTSELKLCHAVEAASSDAASISADPRMWVAMSSDPLPTVQGSLRVEDFGLQALPNQPPAGVPWWLEEAEDLVARNREDEGLDIVYDKLDRLLMSGSFAACDVMLQQVEVTRFSLDILLALLTVTLPASMELPTRAVYFEKVQAELKSRGLDTDELLSGLQGR